MKKVKICRSLKLGNISREDLLDLRYADLAEIRMDFFQGSYDALINEFHEAVKIAKDEVKRIIATNRSRAEGGFFSGNEAERIATLLDVIELVDYVDIELKTPEKYLKKILKKAKENDVKVIVSYHDFEKTPIKEEIKNIFEKETKIGDIGKVAFKVNKPEDILAIYSALVEMRKKQVIGIPMGNPLARILSGIFGSSIIYSGNLAPGQLAAKDTKEMLKWMSTA